MKVWQVQELSSKRLTYLLAGMCSLLLLVVMPFASASPFAPHDTRLTTKDITDFPSVAFGSASSRSAFARPSSPRCKAFPGDSD